MLKSVGAVMVTAAFLLCAGSGAAQQIDHNFAASMMQNVAGPSYCTGCSSARTPAQNCLPSISAVYSEKYGNIALNQPVTQSSEEAGGVASRGVDGSHGDGVWYTNTCTHTSGGDPEWWQVDLGDTYSVTDISLYHRTECCHDRLTGAHIWLSATNDYTDTGVTECSSVTDGGDVAQPEVGTCSGATGQFITVQHSGQSFTICEFEATSGTVAATSSAPFFSGSCVATECPADSSGTDVGSGCTCDTGFGGTITAFP